MAVAFVADETAQRFFSLGRPVWLAQQKKQSLWLYPVIAVVCISTQLQEDPVTGSGKNYARSSLLTESSSKWGAQLQTPDPHLVYEV